MRKGGDSTLRWLRDHLRDRLDELLDMQPEDPVSEPLRALRREIARASLTGCVELLRWIVEQPGAVRFSMLGEQAS